MSWYVQGLLEANVLFLVTLLHSLKIYNILLFNYMPVLYQFFIFFFEHDSL